MGLGWDPVDTGRKKGFLSGLFGGGGGGDIDLDASVIVLDEKKTIIDTVWFSQLKSNDGAIRHGGDNLTGDGDGDDEVIYVDLPKLNSRARWLVFTVNSYSGQTFNEVDNAVARLVDDTNHAEICRFVLAEKGAHTGVLMASLEKTDDGWVMKAYGVPVNGRTVKDMATDSIRILG